MRASAVFNGSGNGSCRARPRRTLTLTLTLTRQKGVSGWVTEGSMTCRIRMAGQNKVLTGLLIPLYPGSGMMSAGVDRGASRSRVLD